MRLMSYENALKVISFVKTNDTKDHANITSGGVKLNVLEENWSKVIDFIKSLDAPYEINVESPYETKNKIIKELKENGIIK